MMKNPSYRLLKKISEPRKNAMGKELGAKSPEREPLALFAWPFASESVVASRLSVTKDMSLFHQPARA
jgi:hypothetical protein